LVSSKGANYTSTNLASAYESTASGGDPLFFSTANLPNGFTGSYGVNLAPNRNGFSLQQNSPGLNKGVALSTGFAGSINSIGRSAGGWDIGAYENQGATMLAPVAPTNLRIVQ
jgi:hypothetical protein